jgi:NitT/TauT family transport system permease protein
MAQPESLTGRAMSSTNRSKPNVLVTRSAIILLMLLLMELGPRNGLISPLILPPLTEIGKGFVTLLENPGIWADFYGTITRVFISFSCAVITGIPLGLALWRMPRVYKLLAPYLGSYFALPIFAFYPVLIAVFGMGATPMILVGYVWAVIAVAESSAAGFNSIPETYHRIGYIYRLSEAKKLFKIYVPAAAPSLFSGIRLAASYAMIGIIASEFVLSTDGMGRRILFYFQDFQLDLMYAAIAIIMVFQIALISSLGLLERSVGKHRNFA